MFWSLLVCIAFSWKCLARLSEVAVFRFLCLKSRCHEIFSGQKWILLAGHMERNAFGGSLLLWAWAYSARSIGGRSRCKSARWLSRRCLTSEIWETRVGDDTFECWGKSDHPMRSTREHLSRREREGPSRGGENSGGFDRGMEIETFLVTSQS